MKDKQSFEQWMKQVNREVNSIAWCSVYDLPDVDFRAMYDCGEPPRSAAVEALEYAGYDMDLIGEEDW